MRISKTLKCSDLNRVPSPVPGPTAVREAIASRVSGAGLSHRASNLALAATRGAAIRPELLQAVARTAARLFRSRSAEGCHAADEGDRQRAYIGTRIEVDQALAAFARTDALMMRPRKIRLSCALERGDERVDRCVEGIARAGSHRISASFARADFVVQAFAQSVEARKIDIDAEPGEFVVPIVSWSDVADYRQSSEHIRRNSVWDGSAIIQRLPCQRTAHIRPASVVTGELADPQ